jgi:hypothetical protein
VSGRELVRVPVAVTVVGPLVGLRVSPVPATFILRRAVSPGVGSLSRVGGVVLMVTVVTVCGVVQGDSRGGGGGGGGGGCGYPRLSPRLLQESVVYAGIAS